MADDELPDAGHEALRQNILATIAAQEQNTADVGDSFAIADVLFDLVDSLLSHIAALKTRAEAAEIREQTEQADIDALQQRVAALENPKAP
jgi:hypothetical protein